MLTLSAPTWQTRWDNPSLIWTCWHTQKMDEVLRAHFCQFTCINTLAALPSLGFHLQLMTLYLLMPCRNMHFFSLWWRQAGSREAFTFSTAHSTLPALSFKNTMGTNVSIIPVRLFQELSFQTPRCAAGKWALLVLYPSLTSTLHQVFKSSTLQKHEIPWKKEF